MRETVRYVGTFDKLIHDYRVKIAGLEAARETHQDVLRRLRDVSTAEGERDLNPAESAEARAAMAERRKIDNELEQVRASLTVAEREYAADQELERRSHQLSGVMVDLPDGGHEWRTVSGSVSNPGEYSPTTGRAVGGATTSDRQGTTPGSGIVRLSDGRPAVVERGQRFGDHPVVAEYAQQRSRSERPVIDTHGGLGNLVRAMTTSSGSAIVPTIWAADIIDRARNNAAVLQAGAQIVPMDAKTLQVGRLTGDPTAAFRTEGSTITASDPTFDNVTLTAKTLSCLVVGSMEFFMDSLDADQVVEQAVGQAMGLELDKQALFGGLTAGAETGATGFNTTFPSPPNPVGVLQGLLSQAASSVLGGATNGTAQTTGSFWSEIVQTVTQPTLYNETPNALIWPAQLAQKYANAYDTTGQPLRRPTVLDNVQTFVSNTIPTNLTQGTSTTQMTDVFAGDFTKLLIGQRLEFQVQVLTERYAENGQIGIVATWRGDVALARPRAFAAYRFLKNT